MNGLKTMNGKVSGCGCCSYPPQIQYIRCLVAAQRHLNLHALWLLTGVLWHRIGSGLVHSAWCYCRPVDM